MQKNFADKQRLNSLIWASFLLEISLQVAQWPKLSHGHNSAKLNVGLNTQKIKIPWDFMILPSECFVTRCIIWEAALNDHANK